MGDDSKLGLSMLAAAAFAVVLAGCSAAPKPNWTTAHPVKPATASEPAADPAAMAEKAEAAVPPILFGARPELVDLRFRPGQVEVSKVDHQALDAVVRWMKAHPVAVVMIEGHTDDLGSRADNLAVGEKRAVSVGKYLIARGIEAERVMVATAGSDRPTCQQKTDACRAQNRRARFLVKQP